jgi:hypothetical protein
MMIASLISSGVLVAVGAVIGAVAVTLFWRKNPNKQAAVNQIVTQESKKL